jgi:hypothetical protein
MGKTLKEKIKRALFAVTFSGENEDPVLNIKIYLCWREKNKFLNFLL